MVNRCRCQLRFSRGAAGGIAAEPLCGRDEGRREQAEGLVPLRSLLAVRLLDSPAARNGGCPMTC